MRTARGRRAVALLVWAALVASYVFLPWIVDGREEYTGYELTQLLGKAAKSVSIFTGEQWEPILSYYPYLLVGLLVAIVYRLGWLTSILSLVGLYIVYRTYDALSFLAELLSLGKTSGADIAGPGLYATLALLLALAVYGPSLGGARVIERLLDMV